MMSEHASETWHSRPDDILDCGQYGLSRAVRSVTGRVVAHCPITANADGDAEACLIAAAPDLLAACEEATAYYEMLERATGVEHGVLASLRAAIAKARGESEGGKS